MAQTLLKPRQYLKILLVEDDPVDAELIEEFLWSVGGIHVHLEAVDRLSQAFQCLMHQDYDAILLDLSLPDSFGIETVKRVKAKVPTIPIVVLTALNDESTALEAVRSGAQDYLVKRGFSGQLLVRSVSYAIERQRVQEALWQQAQRDRLSGRMIERIRSSIDLADILQNTVAEVRQFLNTDGVLIYRCFNTQDLEQFVEKEGRVVAADGARNSCIWHTQIQAFLRMSCLWVDEAGSVQTIDDVRTAELNPEYQKLLLDCQMKSLSIVPLRQTAQWGQSSPEKSQKRMNEGTLGNPIALDRTSGYGSDRCNGIGKGDESHPATLNGRDAATNESYTDLGLPTQKLWGILVACQSTGIRQWQPWEIDFLEHLAAQLAIAIQQSELYRQLATANQKLQRLATMDSLTGIANRRQFDSTLELEWRRLGREAAPLSLILCDIDFFKLYNDYYGHPAGDTCLLKVATALATCTKRPADMAARYGGEEFAVLLPNTDLGGAIAVAQEICRSIETLKLPHPKSPIHSYITISCGVASTIPTIHQSSEVLIVNADRALYQAKARGRNCICQADTLFL